MGYYPFAPQAPADLLQWSIALYAPPAPRDVNRRMPRGLSDILERLLEKEPGRRYPSGQAVHDALVAAAALGASAEWEATVYEWEEGPERRIRRPEPRSGPKAAVARGVEVVPAVGLHP